MFVSIKTLLAWIFCFARARDIGGPCFGGDFSFFTRYSRPTIRSMSPPRSATVTSFPASALKSNGTLVAWGYNYSGQTNVPAGLSGVKAIAAGGFHTLALAPLVSPSITAPPLSLTVNATANAAFSVSATGTAPLIYQWVKDGIDLNGASSATLTFIATDRSLAGTYGVRVSNNVGSVTSSNATLRVLVPQRMEIPRRLSNGRVQLTFRDYDGSGVPDDLGKLILISADALNGTNTVWMTITTGFSINNGYLFIEDIGATNTAQRFYRVIEW